MHAIDAALEVRHRGLRTHPGKLLLGPTGARLWADVLDPRPGFSGVIDVVHKTNLPLLFRVRPEAAFAADFDAVWRPSHLATRMRAGAVSVRERRTITWDDVAISEQVWVNDGDRPVTLVLEYDETWCSWRGDHIAGERHETPHGLPVRVAITASRTDLELAPGASLTLVVAAAVDLADGDDLTARARSWTDDAAVDRAVASYCAWFDDVPRLTTSDPVLDRAWLYRWFILRHNLAEPRTGSLPGPVVYEGRSHKMTKTPWRPEGWEFSKLIPLSTPMHALELRWRPPGTDAVNALRALIGHQGPDGQLVSGTATESMHAYGNFAGWAAYQVSLVQGASALAEVLPVLRAQVLGEAAHLAGDDGLTVQQDHRLTGKEYQPSYWYFADYPDDPRDPAGYTPLKRVDRAVYQYLNARGVAALCRALGVEGFAEASAIAAQVGYSVVEKLWHPDSAFFLDLHAVTDEPALVRNVVGFYPWWAGLADHLGPGPLVAALDDPEGFGTPVPVPSVERRNPVFAPTGGWKGRFLKGRNGCVWNGPAWPYTTSIVLDAVGRTTLREGHRLDVRFGELLRDFVRLHFARFDGRSPYLVEHYDSLTGEPISDEPDYNHSYLIDLIVRYVAGVQPQEGRVLVDPVDIGLSSLRLEGLEVRGHRLDVFYDDAAGWSVRVDGGPARTSAHPVVLEL